MTSELAELQVHGPEPPPKTWRILGAIPCCLLFLAFERGVVVSQGFDSIFQRLGVDLPLPTRLALLLGRWSGELWFLGLPAMLFIGYFYHAWVAKRHPRILWFTMAGLLGLMLALYLFWGGLYLPMIRIEEALRSK